MQLTKYTKIMVLIGILVLFVCINVYSQDAMTFYTQDGTAWIKPTEDTVPHPDEQKAFPELTPDKLLGDMNFLWNVNTGTAVHTLGGKSWYPIMLAPSVQIFKGKAALYLPMNWDKDNEFRDQDYKGGAYGYINRLLFLKWGERGKDPFVLNWGPITGHTIGHGTIMKRYTNMGGFPDIQKRGTVFNADLYFGGMEAMIADWYMRDVWAMHYYVYPLRPIQEFTDLGHWYVEKVLSKTKLGTTLAWDSKASEVTSVIIDRDIENREMNAFTQPINDGKIGKRSLSSYIAGEMRDRRLFIRNPLGDLSRSDPDNIGNRLFYAPYTDNYTKTFVWGIDLEVPVWLDSKSMDVTLYYDHNRVDELASGNHFGVFGHIVPDSADIGYRIEINMEVDRGYVPRYFNSQYELNKYYQYKYYKTLHELDGSKKIGWLFELDRTFFDDKLGIQASIDRVAGDHLDTHFFFSFWLTRLVPGLTMVGFWDRYEIHKFRDTVKEEPLNTRMGAEFAYALSKYVELSVMYTKGFRYEQVEYVNPMDPTDTFGPFQSPQKVQTTSIQTRVLF